MLDWAITFAVLAFIGSLVSTLLCSAFVADAKDDVERWAGRSALYSEDYYTQQLADARRGLRISLLALVLSPIAILWLPLAALGGLCVGLYWVAKWLRWTVKEAFTKEVVES